MKLNHECVRQIMLTIESDIPYNHYFDNDDLFNHKNLKGFTKEEILYTLFKLKEADYIDCHIEETFSDEIYEVTLKALTWSGHQFLDNIRDPEVWKKTKSVTAKFASASLTLISNIAAEVIVRMIDKTMLNP